MATVNNVKLRLKIESTFNKEFEKELESFFAFHYHLKKNKCKFVAMFHFCTSTKKKFFVNALVEKRPSWLLYEIIKFFGCFKLKIFQNIVDLLEIHVRGEQKSEELFRGWDESYCVCYGSYWSWAVGELGFIGSSLSSQIQRENIKGIILWSMTVNANCQNNKLREIVHE